MPDPVEEFAFLMLSHLPAWRERSVEQIELTDALWSVRERVIEVSPFDEVQEEADETWKAAPGWGATLNEVINTLGQRNEHEQIVAPDPLPLLIPLVSLPKDPLFDFRMSVDGQQVFRILRDENGDLQARYIAYLARKVEAARQIDNDLLTLLACVFSFSSSTWEAYRRLYRRFRHPVRLIKSLIRVSKPVREYIENRRGQPIAHSDFEAWLRESRAIGEIVQRHSLPTHRSATENPLLALPKFRRRAPGMNDQDICRTLEKLRNLLQWAQGIADQALRERREPTERERIAGELASTYATYGRRWEAMARCDVPLHRNFEITVHERRLIRFDSPKSSRNNPFVLIWEQLFPRAHYNVSFGDATSNHLHVRVPDQHVQLVARNCRARKDTWEKLPTPPNVQDCPDDERKKHEYYSRYDTKKRDERIWIVCRLRQALYRWAMSWGMIVVTWSAIALISLYGFFDYGHRDLSATDVAVILLPVTFTVSLILTRESSTLGVRVKRALHTALMLFLLSLWGITIALYLSHGIAK